MSAEDSAHKHLKITTDMIVSLTGIVHESIYLPGIVTLNDALDGEYPMVLVAWKIDDPIWKIHSANRSKISDNDPDWVEGVESFEPDSHSWVWGIAPFLTMAPAIKLRDRILRLTAEVGVVPNSYSATIRARA